MSAKTISKVKHTPGPWSLRTNRLNSNGGYIVLLSPSVDGVAQRIDLSVPIDTNLSDAGLEEQEANARLISMAPEMFQLAEQVVETANHGGPDEFESLKQWAQYIIEQARGES